jgi:opine dehydrogenase
MEKPKFAIIGAGHGGHVFAAHLGIMGYNAKIYDIDEKAIKPIQEKGGIELSGVVQGFGKVELATTNIKEAVEGVDVIMVVVPASAHRNVAENLAPHVEDGQIIVLNPGRTFGALEVKNILNSKGVGGKVTVAEAQTLIYLARRTGPAQARMLALKREGSVPLAAIPSRKTDEVLKVLNKVFPTYGRANSVLDTSMNNFGALVHTAPMIFNAGRVESKSPFKWYHEGITKSVAGVLEVLDQERMSVSEAVGANTYSLQEYIFRAYGVKGETVYDAIQHTDAYGGVMGPDTLQHRFIFEDIPTGLVPFASLGELLNVPTPNIKLIIKVASLLVKTDLWSIGRTVQKLGLSGLSAREIQKLAIEGTI